ncbi:MAG TPA: hypothetical protein VF766_10445 [Pyrinomonadaceae bacterium]
MPGFLPIVIVALGAAVIVGLYLIRKRGRQRRLNEIISDPNLLAHFVYAPNEWRRAVEDEFTWVKNKESPGHVYITPTALCVKNDFQERIVELADGGKVVTNVSYRGADGSVLKLRARWRVVEHNVDRPDEVKYFKEDYWIPVPLKQKEDARRVAEFFTAQIENNPQAHANLVADDEPLSLFGKDSL